MADLDTPLRTVVVDDEPPARRKLQRWLEADSEVRVEAACANGYEALDVLAATPTDLLFLDIQMPELSGFDVLDRLPAGVAPIVVFATAFGDYAVEAFRRHAVDYLLKPYDRERFSDTLTHVKRLRRQRSPSELQARLAGVLDAVRAPRPPLDRFAVRRPDGVHLVAVEAVDWIEADGNYVLLHVGAQVHPIREALGTVAARLDARRFPRIHRSTVVNLDRVRLLEPASHGDYTVVLHDGTRLLLSRTYREALRGVLEIGF